MSTLETATLPGATVYVAAPALHPAPDPYRAARIRAIMRILDWVEQEEAEDAARKEVMAA